MVALEGRKTKTPEARPQDKPVRVVDEDPNAADDRDVNVDFRFFRGLIVGAVISAVVYVMILLWLLR
jgi:hypothetical protein